MVRFRLILSMVMVGTIGIFVKNIPLQSQTIAWGRVVLAAAAIGIYLLLSGKKLMFSASRKEIVLLIVSGAALGLNYTFLFEAYQYIPYSIATLCDYFSPVVVMILSPIFFHEKITKRQILCFFLATFGLALLVGMFSDAGEKPNAYGVIVGLTGMLFYVPVMMINKVVKGVDALHRTLLQFVTAAVVLTLVIPFTGGFDFSQMHTAGWLNLLLIGVVHTGICFCLYFSALPKLPAQEGAILSYADPMTAVLVSVLFMQERLGLVQILGGVLLLVSTMANEMPTPKRK